jgi:hypothetical protein
MENRLPLFEDFGENAINLKIGTFDGMEVYRLPKGRTDLYDTYCELSRGTNWCTGPRKSKKEFLAGIEFGDIFLFMSPNPAYKLVPISYGTYPRHHLYDIHGNMIESGTDPYEVDLYKFVHSKGFEATMPNDLKLLAANLGKGPLLIEGDLFVGNGRSKVSLPDGLHVTGKLRIGRRVTELPNNLTVGGHLFMGKSNIKSIPNNLNIGGILYIKDSYLNENYSFEEIRQMIEDKGGSVAGEITDY